MKKMITLATAGLLLTLASCGSVGAGNISVNNGKESDATVKKEIKIADFDEVSAQQGIKIIYSQGPNPGTASVSTTSEAEKYLKITVKNGEMKAFYDTDGMKISNIKIKGPTIIRLTSPVLTEVDLSSGAYFKIEGSYSSSKSMEADLSSGSSFEAESIACSKFEADLSSGAAMNVKSLAGSLEMEASSGAVANVSAATNGDVSVKVSSGASVSISDMASGAVSAKASSGGALTLSGKASSFSKKTSSGGSVSASGLKVTQP